MALMDILAHVCSVCTIVHVPVHVEKSYLNEQRDISRKHNVYTYMYSQFGIET